VFIREIRVIRVQIFAAHTERYTVTDQNTHFFNTSIAL
jgi:hypothetical protein